MDTILLITTIGEAFIALYFIHKCRVLKNELERYKNVVATTELTDRAIPKKRRTMWG